MEPEPAYLQVVRELTQREDEDRVSASTTSSATRAGSSHSVKKLAPGMVTILTWEQAASVSRSDSLTPPSPLSPCTTQAGTPAAHNRGATEPEYIRLALGILLCFR